MIKRFLLFAGDVYYPSGGWEDLVGSYATFGEAQLANKGLDDCDWSYIIDIATGEKHDER